MSRKLLITASVFAVLTSLPAFADTTTASEKAEKAAHDAGVKIERGWDKTKEAVSDAAADAKNTTKNTYNDLKANLADKDDIAILKDANIDERHTAEGIIGKNVYDTNGKAIAKIHDIILDSSGHARTVILADGELFGMGKKVAFDYDLIAKRDADGDVIAPLSEETIKKAVAFSYDRKDAGKENVMVIPETALSVDELMDADLVDANGKDLGDVENIAFENGKAARLIVEFDDVMGLGGKKAIVNYDNTSVVRRGDDYDLKLSANQISRLQAYKKSVN